MIEKICRNCEKKFVVGDDDLEFYKKISQKFDGKVFEIPSPSLCFSCRHQKRLSFRNEIFLYHRKCDRTGRQIISMYSPDKPYTVYDQSVWWSDEWDPLEYGQEFDFSKSFFEQYLELQKKVPRMSLNNISAENSDYCNLAFNNKDSYLIFTADYNEKSAYLRFSDKNFQCFDCDYTYESTECYECLDTEKGNRCLYCWKCYNSSNLFFCYNMIGCQDCIGCCNLRNKKYFIFNKQYSKDEFEKLKNSFEFQKYSGVLRFKKDFEEFLKSQPHKYIDVLNCENSLGDNLRGCKNVYQCYNCKELEDCKYMINCYFAKDCYDWDFVGLQGSTHCHEMVSSAFHMNNCHFCANCWEGDSNLFYSELCLSSKNLFGCIGLRHKENCILNKQYSEKEYEGLVAKIIEHMQKPSPDGQVGEWGEFFPQAVSTFSYNETVAHEYFPYSKEEVLKKGLRWKDDESEDSYKGPRVEIPDDINGAEEELCRKILICNETEKPYKIIPQEFEFCKKLKIPLPRIHWMKRHKNRMAQRNPWMLWGRKCDKCGKELMSTYKPGRTEPIYCEECYKKEIY